MRGFAAVSGLGAGLLLASCQATKPVHEDDPNHIAVARLNWLLGINARTYAFTLRPGESLVVTFRARKNGADEPGDSFTHVIDYDVYQKFDQNYPTFEPLHGKRFVDIQILNAGRAWNLRQVSADEVKVTVSLPSFERNYLYNDPANSSTEFGKGSEILAGPPTVLLKLHYEYRTGEKRELTVEAQIRSRK
jgi:hypothetical protein